ncbi:MAG: PQQ-binding-like beta-propeller repeat protein [Phycisphaerae bacterium]|nr:PQQ-binding-like beta-propeller repeat protein [Phycisphaerae bacterium]
MTTNLKSFMTGWIGIFCIAGVAMGNWPEFRGVNGIGVIPDSELPVKWSKTENVAWKVKIKGKGWSSPVVSDGKVFVTVATEDKDGDPRALRVVCLNAKTGTIDWDKKVFAPRGKGIKHPKNSHASATPLVCDGRIYAHFAHMGTACLDLNGQIKWKMNAFKYKPMHGTGSSPVLVGDNLIFNCDAEENPFIAAVNKDTGQVAWKTPRTKTEAKNNFSFCTPAVVEVAGKKQIVSPGSGAVWGYNPLNGKELWRVDYGLGYSVTPRPICGHGMVFVSSGFGDEAVYALRPGGKGNVTDSHVAWKFAKDGPKSPTPLLIGHELYIVEDGGKITCLDALTGTLHWQERIKGAYSASPVSDGKKIYITSEKGLVTVIKTGKTFNKLAENDMEEKTYATPAIDKNGLIIRTETTLYRIEKK